MDKDSGIASNDSGSRRDSLSSMASMASNDSGISSMSGRRSSTSSNVSSMSGLIQIQVEDHNNKTHIVRVRPTDKVKDLKVKIQEKLKIAPSQQRLQFQGKMLEDMSTSLKYHKLFDSCTVRLHLRTLGGALFSTA